MNEAWLEARAGMLSRNEIDPTSPYWKDLPRIYAWANEIGLDLISFDPGFNFSLIGDYEVISIPYRTMMKILDAAGYCEEGEKDE